MTEEEITENNVEDENTQNAEAAVTTEEDSNDIPVISSIEDVEEWDDAKLLEHILQQLHFSAQSSDESKPYFDYLYRTHFGEEYTAEDVAAPIDDERQQKVASEYLKDRIELIKNQSLSLDKGKNDKSFEEMFAIIGINIDISDIKEEVYDKIFTKRIGHNADLMEDYQVLTLNRNLANIYNQHSGYSELSHYIAAMEEAYTEGAANREQLAQFYYNVSEIYKVEANGKNNMPDINRVYYRASEYRKKALTLTSKNITMISDIQTELKSFPDYDPEQIIDACTRVIDNNISTEADKHKAHKLCADTLLNLQKIDGFAGKNQRVDKAIKHYRAALAYSSQPEEKYDILNSIANAQKHIYPEEYFKTRIQIANMLEGRSRIREFEKLAGKTKDNNLQQTLFKACINEFRELEEINKDDRLLYDRIDEKLRTLLPKDDTKTIRKLNQLRKKYGNSTTKKTQEPIILTMSSKGHDYFI